MRTFAHHGGYRYTLRVDGCAKHINLGRDRMIAVELATGLNALHREQRNRVFGRVRAVCDGLRQEVHKRDDYRCVYCGTAEDLTVDHFIPFAKGGATHVNNLVTACVSCNGQKGNRGPIEFLAAIVDLENGLIRAMVEKFIPLKVVFPPADEIDAS